VQAADDQANGQLMKPKTKTIRLELPADEADQLDLLASVNGITSAQYLRLMIRTEFESIFGSWEEETEPSEAGGSFRGLPS